MYEISEDTFIIDTPGIKELGLFDIEKEEIYHFFPEMRERFGQCRFHNCLHINEPKCAVIQAVEDGEIDGSKWSFGLSKRSKTMAKVMKKAKAMVIVGRS